MWYSIVFIIVLMIFSVAAAKLPPKENRAARMRCFSAVAQVTVSCTVVLFALETFKDMYVLSNEYFGLFERSSLGLDCYTSGHTVILSAAVIAVLFCLMSFVKPTEKKRILTFAVASGAVVAAASAGLATVLLLADDGFTTAMIPAVVIVAWSCLVCISNMTLDAVKKWQRIVFTAVNSVNLVGVVALIATVFVWGKDVIGAENVDALGMIIIASVVIMLSVWSIICLTASFYEISKVKEESSK